MNDETPAATATAPTDEPKVQTPAPADSPDTAPIAPAEPEPNPHPFQGPAEEFPAAPQAEAAAAEEPTPEFQAEATAAVEPTPEPRPEGAAETKPSPPSDMTEVAAEVVRLNEEPGAAEQPEQTAEVAPETAEPPEETAPEPVPPLAAVEPADEASPGAEPESVTPKAEEEPSAKPARAKKPRAKPAKAAAVAVAEEPTGEATPAEEPAEAAEPKPENKKKWYAVKVQSGREDTIKAAILRKVAIEGLEEYFGEIAIPVEEVIEKKAVRVKDKKTGEYTTQERKVTKKRKKFHGYIFANVEFNDRILYLFRETSGVGDFLNVRGSPGNPIAEPMPEHEVQAMLTGVATKDPTKKPKVKLDFEKGDKVRIREGSFANHEGEIKEILEAKDPTEPPKVTVELTFWGRPLKVDFDAWQVEKV